MNNNPNNTPPSSDDAFEKIPPEIFEIVEKMHARFPKPPRCRYSRKQALAEGRQIRVPSQFIQKMNKEWDFGLDLRSCILFTQSAVEACEYATGKGLYEDCGPAWEVFCILDSAYGSPMWGRGIFPFTRYHFTIGGEGERPKAKLDLVWSTFDIDDYDVAYTVALPGECR